MWGFIVAIHVCIKYVVQKNTRNPTTNDITQPNLPDETLEGNEAYASTGGALGVRVGSNIRCNSI